MKKAFSTLLHSHRALGILLVLQLVFLAGLGVLSLRSPVRLTFSPQQLTPTGALPVTQGEGESLRVWSEEPVERCAVFSLPLALPSGAYDLTIQYRSVSHPQDPSGNLYDCAGWAQVSLLSNPNGLRSQSIPLSDASDTATGRIWLRMGAGAQDLTLDLNYYGEGILEIAQVQVTEYLPYRAARLAGFFLLFLTVDLAWLFFSPKNPLKIRVPVRGLLLGVAIITFFASLDFLGDFLLEGHDLAFHLNRIQALADALAQGQFPQRIQSGMLNAYGYLSPVFYGDFFLILPAGLLLLGLPLQTAYQIFGVGVNLATAALTAWCLYRLVPDWKKALAGSALYTLSTYRLLNLVVRASVGEYLAMIFLPLILYGLIRVYTAREDQPLGLRETLPLIIGLTGILQSHLLTCEMTAFFLLALAVIFWSRTFRPRRFLALARAALVTLGLNLWYLVPLLQSMISLDLKYKTQNLISDIESQSAYLLQLFALYPTSVGGSSGKGVQGEMPMGLGPALVAALILFLAWWAARPHLGEKGKKSLGTMGVLLGFGGAALLLASHLIPWQNLSHISATLYSLVGMVQFPSRYLGMATVCLVFATVLLLDRLEKDFSPKWSLLAMGVLGALVFLFAGKLTGEAANEMAWYSPYTLTAADSLTVMGGEYLPSGTDPALLEERALLPGENVSGRELNRQGTRSQWELENASSSPSWVDLPLLAYPNYEAADQEGGSLALSTGENGRLRVTIPGGYEGVVTVEYREPVLWRTCEGLSLITLAGLVLLCRYPQNSVLAGGGAPAGKGRRAK